MSVRIAGYKNDNQYSYCLGASPTLELLAARPRSVVRVLLTTDGGRNSGVAMIREMCGSLDIPVETNDKAVRRLSPKENHYAVAVFNKYAAHLHADENHVVLINPSDMGNLGTVARTMIAFGFHNLALIRPAADVFHPKAIRASMGALFRLEHEYYDGFDEYRTAFRHALYPLMTDGRTALDEAVFRPPFALVFGSESQGLPPRFLDEGTSVAIPKLGEVDSLNLSAAAAIALYAARKR